MSSAEKVLNILKILGDPPYELGLTEIANKVNIGKSGAYKLMCTLEQESFVKRNISTKKYQLGPVLFRLGNVYSELKGIWKIAKPIMHSIHNMTQMTVFIGIREGDDSILAYKVDSPGVISYKDKVGRYFPINAGVIGKLLTAYQPQEDIERLLRDKKLEQITPNSITDPEKLLEEYKTIKDRGYAISKGEHDPGAFGISAPIRDRNGEISFCLGLSGPKMHLPEKNIENWIRFVIDGAMEISFRLGFRN